MVGWHRAVLYWGCCWLCPGCNLFLVGWPVGVYGGLVVFELPFVMRSVEERYLFCLSDCPLSHGGLMCLFDLWVGDSSAEWWQ